MVGDNYGGGIAGVTVATTKVGTQTNAFANTSVLDGTAHIMTHAVQDVDIVYQFLAGGGTSPVSIVWTGMLNPINDTLTISVWNHGGTAWEVIATQPGQTSTTAWVVRNLVLYARHIGTSAAELGKVYLRLNSAAAYNHILRTDQVYLTYAVTSRSVGYADGAVWVKAAGTAGTELFVNGTADNPCPWANAQTIATALGLSRFRIINGETVTLIAATENKVLIGYEWTIALGGQSIAGTHIEGASVSGVSSGDGTHFVDCEFPSTATIGTAEFDNCGFEGTLTFVANKDYSFVSCHDDNASTATQPIFTFAATNNVGFRQWSGGLEIASMVATDYLTLDGAGRLVIAATCNANPNGYITIRGQDRKSVV